MTERLLRIPTKPDGKPPRKAIHDFDDVIMRDFIADGRVMGSIFSSRGNALVACNHPGTDHNNWQEVGTAAALMS